MTNKTDYNNIPKELFEPVERAERITDKKFEDKPIGYFTDAWLRFRRNKGSIVAAIIILLIVLFSIVVPIANTRYDSTFMDVFYAEKPPKNFTLMKLGIANGQTTRTFEEKGLLKFVAVGVGAADTEGKGGISVAEGMANYYQPIRSIKDSWEIAEIKGAKPKVMYNASIDNYLEVGFMYKSIQQSE